MEHSLNLYIVQMFHNNFTMFEYNYEKLQFKSRKAYKSEYKNIIIALFKKHLYIIKILQSNY